MRDEPTKGVETRFLPCVFDRLTDLRPWERMEMSSERSFRPEQFHRAVLEDLNRLFWSTPTLDRELEGYPEASLSVINYGIPNLLGKALDDSDLERIEEDLRRRLIAYEPRFFPEDLEVQVARNRMKPDVVECHIRGRLWMIPYPVQFELKTVLDLGSGRIVLGDRVVNEAP